MEKSTSSKIQDFLNVLGGGISTGFAILGVIASFTYYIYTIDGLKAALAEHEDAQVTTDNNQTLILQKLAVIESKQDRNTEDIKEILKELKTK